MQKSKEQLIDELKGKREEIRRMCPVEDRYFSYPDRLIMPYYIQSLADDMLKMIQDLVRITPDEGGSTTISKYRFALENLMHRRRKEISFLDNGYRNATKKGATLKSKNEYRADVFELSQSICRDISSIF